MTSTIDATRLRPRAPQVLRLAVLVLVPSACACLVTDPLQARAASLASLCVLAWLLELVPPFVPTLVLAAGAPWLLGPLEPSIDARTVLAWCAEPVLALFFGGFVLAAAARRVGLDHDATEVALHAARGRRRWLLVLLGGATALLSMWISNTAAAALVFAALRPALSSEGPTSGFRRACLLSVAMGANVGGMATPIGSGPNGIALASIEHVRHVSFLGWTLLALPLTVGLLVVVIAWLIVAFRVGGSFDAPRSEARAVHPRRARFLLLFCACVALWLTEPWHGVDAAVVALAAAAGVFGLGLLTRDDLARIDWSTLLLVAGGLMVGRLLEATHLLDGAAVVVMNAALPPLVRTFAFVGGAALLSSLMSNTATAVLLIPLAMRVDATGGLAILTAVGCSFGAPFSISTPPNALAAGEGASGRDLLVAGVPLFVLGCAVVAGTGPSLLARLFPLP